MTQIWQTTRSKPVEEVSKIPFKEFLIIKAEKLFTLI